MYRIDGDPDLDEYIVEGWEGYRGSSPVRIGNGATGQQQLDIYGELLDTARLYSEARCRIDGDTGAVLAQIVDRVCDIWRQPDSGMWEVRNGPFQFTHSKVMCWVAI